MCNYTTTKLVQCVISLVSLISMLYVLASADPSSNNQCTIIKYVLPVPVYAIISVSLNFFFIIFSIFEFECCATKLIEKVDDHKCLFWAQIFGRLCLLPIACFVIFGTKFECKNDIMIVPIILGIDCLSQCIVIPLMWYMFNTYMQTYTEKYYEGRDNNKNSFCCCY